MALAPVGQDQRLTVYTGQASYAVVVVQRNGTDYVALADLLQPLGSTVPQADSTKWKLHFNDVEATFEDGNTRAKVGGHNVDLPSPFHLENGRGLVPVSSLQALLARLLNQPIDLHPNPRRLFIGGVATHFSLQLSGTASDSVVLNFSAPVNPMIATEPGQLRMTFQRDPVVHAGPEVTNLAGKSVSAIRYHEENGSAEITLTSAAPLLARFSADRKTITVSPVSQVAAISPRPGTTTATAPKANPPAAALPAPAVTGPIAAGAPTAAPVPTPPVQQIQPIVIVDAGHGGTERGEALSPTVAEKDVTLEIARRLQHDLDARGIRSILLRDSDISLTLEQRAALTNTSRAQMYIGVHADTLGTGVRVYTTLLPPAEAKRGPFLPWRTAQAEFSGASQNLAGSIAAQLTTAQIASRSLLAPVPPLDHIACAAVAVEVAPSSSDINELNGANYQEQVANAIAAGVAEARRLAVSQ